MNRTRLAAAAVVVAAAAPLVGCSGSTTDQVDALAPKGEAQTAAPADKAVGAVPGAGEVDVPRGEMMTVEPFDPAEVPDGAGAVGLPVKVGGFSEDLSGLVDWDDFYPTEVPTSDKTPAPMVPIRNEAGDQLAWWAPRIGWVSFEEVTADSFDYDKLFAVYSQSDSRAIQAADVSRAALYQNTEVPAG